MDKKEKFIQGLFDDFKDFVLNDNPNKIEFAAKILCSFEESYDQGYSDAKEEVKELIETGKEVKAFEEILKEEPKNEFFKGDNFSNE